jgi:hypothetical protein
MERRAWWVSINVLMLDEKRVAWPAEPLGIARPWQT